MRRFIALIWLILCMAQAGVMETVGQAQQGQPIQLLFMGEPEASGSGTIASNFASLLGPDRIHIAYSKVMPGPEIGEISPFDAVIFTKNENGETPETGETWRATQQQIIESISAAGKGAIWVDLNQNTFDRTAEACGGVIPEMYGTETPAAICSAQGERAGGSGYIWLADPAAQLQDSDIRSGVREMILATVGDEVVNRWKRSALAPLSYSSPEVPIPNYEDPEQVVLKQAPLLPEASMQYMHVAPGFEVQLFAAEPDIINPVSMTWDERGRLWVIETLDYPNQKKPLKDGQDRIKIFEDTDADGRADKMTVFAEGLSIATGLTFSNDGVIVSAPPEMLFLKDTDGDDVADVYDVLFDGFLTFDTHAGVSNLRYGFDNWIWTAIGYAGFEGVIGGQDYRFKQGLFRLKPDMTSLDYLAHLSNNTWGLGFSENGDVFASTANNEHSVYLAIPERYFQRVSGFDKAGHVPSAPYKKMHPITDKVRQVDVLGGFTAATGHTIYTARHFPEAYWNRAAFVNEPTGHLIHQAFVKQEGTQFMLDDGWNIMANADEWSAPVMSEVGPDGALWVLDWYDLIIQHNPIPEGFEAGEGDAYETPNRDLERGRIYRIVHKDRPLDEPMALRKDDPEGLVRALSHKNQFWRLMAQRLLVERGDKEVYEDLVALLGDQRVDEAGTNGGVLHALWTLHGLGFLDGSHPEAIEEVRRVLSHPAIGVRRAALQVLPPVPGLWADLKSVLMDEEEDLLIVMTALLKLTELPERVEIGRMLYEMQMREAVVNDPWLPTAVALASAQHMEGYLGALLEDETPDIQRNVTEAALTNGSFENVDGDLPAGWDVEPYTWPLEETNPNVYTHSVVEEGRSGRALKISSPTGADVGVYTMVPVKPNTDYLLTGWIKTEDLVNLGGGYGAVIDVLTFGRTRTIRGTSGWTWVEKEFNSGSATEVRIQCHLGRWGQYKGTAWFDDLRLVEQGEASVPAFVAETVIRHIGSGADAMTAMSVLAGIAGASNEVRELVVSSFAENWPAGQRPAMAPSDDLYRASMGPHLTPEQLQIFDQLLERWAGDTTMEPHEPEGMVSLSLEAEIGTLRFAQDELTVQAGQLVKLSFVNPDAMPHNVVIGQPGSLEEIGAAADALASSADGAERDYVPESDKIVIASSLVQSGESIELTFVAPEEPGEYPFLCTFPGHWRIMNGVLRVEARP